jgi:putative peptidoglycan lipid II flippase
MALPLTRLLFEHGEFNPSDSQRTAALIVAYGTGVWAFCALPILYRGFYALGDRLAPVRVGLWAVLVDMILNLTLIWPLAERGLAWSTAVSAIGQASCLVWLMQRRVGRLDWARLTQTAARTLVATAVMGAACVGAMRLFPYEPEGWPAVVAVVVPVAAGIAAYLIAAKLLGIDELGWLMSRSAPGDDSAG